MKKVNWVFWFNVSIRRNWFSYFWKTRGANFIEIQFFIFKISIGLPWHKNYINSIIRDYGSNASLLKTNEMNLKSRWAILMPIF